jgi:hypothetical protein
VKDQVTISKKELSSVQALAVAVLNITPRQEEEPAPVKVRAPRKGLSDAQKAVNRRNQRILK